MGSVRNLTPAADKKWAEYDHAGRCECSMLEHLCPGSIKLDRLPETHDRFAWDSANTDIRHGIEKSDEYVESFIKFTKLQKGEK